MHRNKQGGGQNKEKKKHVPNERAVQNPRKELSKMETHNQPGAEFKTLVMRMLNEFRGRVDELSESFN